MSVSRIINPKISALMAELRLPCYAAVGLLECLWDWSAKYAPNGVIGKYPDETIAAAVDWNRPATELISALIICGYVKRNSLGKLVLKQKRYYRPDLSAKRWKRLRLEIAKRDGTICAYCGIECGKKFSIDHITPYRCGGTSDPDNLCVACIPCNSRKGAF